MAEPGPCTNTAGYISNAEINEIILGGGNMKTYHDGGSNSDILVYDGKTQLLFLPELSLTV